MITYGDHALDLRVRIFNPKLEYSAPSFTDGNNSTITSFSGKTIVNANIKVRNRVACDTLQTAVIFAAVYNGNKLSHIKKLTDTPVPASQEITLTAAFTAAELANVTMIKIIALDGGETIGNLLNSITSITSITSINK